MQVTEVVVVLWHKLYEWYEVNVHFVLYLFSIVFRRVLQTLNTLDLYLVIQNWEISLATSFNVLLSQWSVFCLVSTHVMKVIAVVSIFSVVDVCSLLTFKFYKLTVSSRS